MCMHVNVSHVCACQRVTMYVHVHVHASVSSKLHSSAILGFPTQYLPSLLLIPHSRHGGDRLPARHRLD